MLILYFQILTYGMSGAHQNLMGSWVSSFGTKLMLTEEVDSSQ